MTYQIPKNVQEQQVRGEGTQPLYVVRPTRDVRLNSATVQMFIKGHVGSTFKMRLNVYSGTEQGRLLFRSNPVSIDEVERSGDYFFNLRFDFPIEGNIWSLEKDHLVEFEIYDGYTYDQDNYLSLILDYFGRQAFFGTDVENLGKEGELSHVVSLFFDVKEVEKADSFFLVEIIGSRLVVEPSETIPTALGDIYRFKIDKGMHVFLAESWIFGGFLHNYFNMQPKPLSLTNPIDFTGYYDEESGTLDLYPGLFGAIGNTIVVHYSIYITDTIGRVTPSEYPNKSQVYWEPRIRETPSLSYSQQDILGGIMSTATSPLSISNEDGWFDKYLGPLHTFLNRGVYIRRCKGSEDNISATFLGAISSINGDSSSLTISINDITSIFEYIYSDNLPLKWGDIPPLSLSETGKEVIIPRLFGRSGPYELMDYNTNQVRAGGEVAFIKALDPSKMIKTECITLSATIANNTNRSWGVCFGVESITPKEFNISHIYEDTNGTFKEVIFQIDMPSNDFVGNYLQAGDTIRVGASNYAIVNHVAGDLVHVWPYTTIYIGATKIYRESVSALVIKKGDLLFYPIAHRDYTVGKDPSGFVGITFKNNFEATFGGLGNLDPNSVEVYAKVWNDSGDPDSSSVVKRIIMGAGLTPASDFEPVGVPNPFQWPGIGPDTYYPNPALSFTVPFMGTNQMPTYREVLERVLVSSTSYIYMDKEFKWRWNTYLNTCFRDSNHTPSSDYSHNRSGLSLKEVVDSKAYTLEGISYDYEDIYTSLEVTANHNPYSSPLYRFERETLKLFYGFNKPYKIETLCMTSHYLYDYFETSLLRFLSGRKGTFSINLKDYRGENIGDVIRADIKGMSTTLGLVTSRDDSDLGTTILINDAERFPKDI